MSETSRRLLLSLRALAVSVIALHLVAPSLDESNAWGLWPATYLPAPWRWALAIASIGLAFFGGEWLAQIARHLNGFDLRSRRARVLLALLSIIPFYLFRIQHLRWGDAYILVNAIPHPDARLTYVWQAPLDVYLHARAWALGNHLFGWADPIPVYAILSAAAGAIFVYILLGLAAWMGRNRVERALVVGLVITLGTMQLFFGYIENYSFMTVAVLAYIWLALKALEGETALVWPAAALALAHGLHPSTLILAPSLVYLGWLVLRRPESRLTPGRALASIAAPYLLVGTGVFLLMSAGGHGLDALLGIDFPGGGDRRWFVPLLRTETRWEHYTMFSLGHLLDIVNEQLLVAPVILPGLALTALLAWRRLPLRDPALRLLAVIAGLYLLLTLVWNPDYGGQRDWDLFAPAAVPAAVLLAYVLPRALTEVAALRDGGMALIAAQGFHTVIWIYQNTLHFTL